MSAVLQKCHIPHENIALCYVTVHCFLCIPLCFRGLGNGIVPHNAAEYRPVLQTQITKKLYHPTEACGGAMHSALRYHLLVYNE